MAKDPLKILRQCIKCNRTAMAFNLSTGWKEPLGWTKLSAGLNRSIFLCPWCQPPAGEARGAK